MYVCSAVEVRKIGFDNLADYKGEEEDNFPNDV